MTHRHRKNLETEVSHARTTCEARPFANRRARAVGFGFWVSLTGAFTRGMSDGADDGGKAAAVSAKRRRIESLDRRFAGKGVSVSSTNAIFNDAGRAGPGGRGGRGADRGSSTDKHRGGARGGHGELHLHKNVHRNGNDSSASRGAHNGRAVHRADDDTRAGDTIAPDEAWYAPLTSRTMLGVIAAAHATAVPDELREPEGGTNAVAVTKMHRVLFIEDSLRRFARTNKKAGADCESVVRGKTKDKVVLLDAANAACGDFGKCKHSKASSRSDFELSRTALRAVGVAGALTASQTSWVKFAPMRDAFQLYVDETMKGLGDVGSQDEPSLRIEATCRMYEQQGNEIRGAVVTVCVCRDVKLVGRVGVVARVTAMAIFLVTDFDAAIVAPRKGTSFRLELTVGHAKKKTHVTIKGEDACV